MVNMSSVAREAGASRYTVSKVLNGDPTVKEDTRRRVLAACERLQYTRNEHALRLVRGESRTIGLLTPQITDTFFGEIITAAEDSARRAGYHLIHQCSYDDAENEARIIRSFLSLRVQGIVAAPVVRESNRELWRQVEEALPVVYFDRYLDEQCHYVVTDNEASARLVTEHLLSSGRRVAYIGNEYSPNNNAILSRNAGYMKTVLAAGQRPLLIPTRANGCPADDFAFGYENMKTYLASERPPEAVFCVTDRVAVGVMRALGENRLTVGEDVLVAGHDDFDFGKFTTPSLTSVAQPKTEIGRQVTSSLISMAEGKRARARKVRKRLAPRLIVRESSLPGGG